jgi:hypothetical protein
MTIFVRILLFFTLLSSHAIAQTTQTLTDDERAAILARVKSFYSWAIENGGSVQALEPRIRNAKGNARFYLDVSTLNAFSTAFMRSGDFSTDFRSKVENYYSRYRKEFNAYPQEKFAQLTQGGRGPLMETEDMDIFFCAQEYEYAQPFIEQMKLADIKINGNIASATVVSPYDWKTEFQFKKVGTRWLISAYCQYK